MDTYTRLLAAMIFLSTLYIGFAVWFGWWRSSMYKPEDRTTSETGEWQEFSERHGMSEAICRAFLGERPMRAPRSRVSTNSERPADTYEVGSGKAVVASGNPVPRR
jgi:hypothetical protein